MLAIGAFPATNSTRAPEDHVMDKNAPSPAVEAFWRYTRSFQSLNPGAMAAHFNAPALMITPQSVRALPDGAAVERVYAHVMAELPARRYARTDFSALEERRLSDGVVVLTGSGTWVALPARSSCLSA
jgi:hypothetical protein